MIPRSASAVRIAVAALGLAVMSLLAAAAPASAHDRLVSSDPANGAVLTTAPATITLTYNAELLPTGAQVAITDAAGSTVATGAPQVADTTVTAPLPADLPAGGYDVAWRVVSSDGHPIEGKFAFTLEAPVEVQPGATASATPGTSAAPTGGASSASGASPTGEVAAQEPTTPAASQPEAQDASSAVWWVAGATVVLGLAVAVTFLVLRRRSGGGAAS